MFEYKENPTDFEFVGFCFVRTKLLYLYVLNYEVMDAKLTLKLDKSVIEKAKIYAAEHKHSLSLLVENYLKAITETEKKNNAKEIEISSFVKSLTLGKGQIPVDFDYKKERQDYLSQKYK